MNNKLIAYFSAEFAFDSKISQYAGGLGILAGDFLKEASDQELPLVAVGLMYGKTNLTPILEIEVPIQDQKTKVQVYKHMVGNIAVYLLGNETITQKLYVANKETRLKQEIILGIGGLRALEILGIYPDIFHLNEGHSAFLTLELIAHEMKEKHISFSEAIFFAKKQIIFTNHTLVAAGSEIYGVDLISLALSGYAKETGIPMDEIIKLGLVKESSIFSLTMLAMRMSENVNAVSKLHANKASEIWTEHTMTPITNGVHIKSWDMVGDDVVVGHQKQKELLTSTFNWDQKCLILGWARRFVEYKRPLAILDQIERFAKISRNSQFPVKIIFSGGPHEADKQGQKLLEILQRVIKDKIGDIAVYVPDYNVDVAKKLVSGCDVWLNTPVVGYEACGTSGMKAALNGTLPCSTRDGWVEEIDLYKVGWALDDDNLQNNILDILEYDIVPMFYQNKSVWYEHMQNARNLVKTKFSTTRMLGEYQERFYEPLSLDRA